MNVGCKYTVVRSRRKTIGIHMNLDGSLLVKAPVYATQQDIDRALEASQPWIEKHRLKMEKLKNEVDEGGKLSPAEINQLADQALKVIPQRVAYYAPLVGVDYGRITIRNQKTKWGSCSNKGNLNFNCLLMLAPPRVLDSIVVHELCHRKEMNHSKKFYEEVLRVMPDYWEQDRWLKEHGSALMARANLIS